jgi:cell division protease FtsH
MTGLDTGNRSFDAGWLERHRLEVAGLSWDDIVGVGYVVSEVKSLVGRLLHPDIVEAAGAELPRGVLLHGPPGTGKTLAARLIASSLGDMVPFFEVPADELTADRVRGSIEYLSTLGRRAVLYVDEIDAFARDRLDFRHDAETREVLYAMLSSLDGIRTLAGPLLLASTTAGPEALDGALIRSGRIGFRIAFDLPDQYERETLLMHFAQDRTFDGPVDLGRMARIAEPATPADLRQLLDDALGLALGEGRTRPRQEDLDKATRRRGTVRPEMGTPESRQRVAIHEAGHAIVAAALVGQTYVRSIRVSSTDGLTMTGEEHDSLLLATDQQVADELAIAYGGSLAERRWLHGAGMGALFDHARIADLLTNMANAGMIEGLPPFALTGFKRLTWPTLRSQFGRGVTAAARAARQRASRAIELNGDPILRLARVFDTTDDLGGAELQDFLEGLDLFDPELIDD